MSGQDEAPPAFVDGEGGGQHKGPGGGFPPGRALLSTLSHVRGACPGRMQKVQQPRDPIAFPRRDPEQCGAQPAKQRGRRAQPEGGRRYAAQARRAGGGPRQAEGAGLQVAWQPGRGMGTDPFPHRLHVTETLLDPTCPQEGTAGGTGPGKLRHRAESLKRSHTPTPTRAHTLHMHVHTHTWGSSVSWAGGEGLGGAAPVLGLDGLRQGGQREGWGSPARPCL